MAIKPLFARVLLQREVLKSASIIITDSASLRNAPTKGKVIAVGPTADASIEVGKTYVFGRHAGAWLNKDGKPVDKVDDAEFFVCVDEDLICEVTP
jgi:co-chaperonin GroES (HSP10)